MKRVTQDEVLKLMAEDQHHTAHRQVRAKLKQIDQRIAKLEGGIRELLGSTANRRRRACPHPSFTHGTVSEVEACGVDQRKLKKLNYDR